MRARIARRRADAKIGVKNYQRKCDSKLPKFPLGSYTPGYKNVILAEIIIYRSLPTEYVWWYPGTGTRVLTAV